MLAREMAMNASRRLMRIAELRFAHPYAVVAVTQDTRRDPVTGAVARGPWHGLPVFSGWVTEPQDAADDVGDPPA